VSAYERLAERAVASEVKTADLRTDVQDACRRATAVAAHAPNFRPRSGSVARSSRRPSSAAVSPNRRWPPKSC
jgi:hypothetical protein